MANNTTGNGSQPQQAPEGITRITVGGFKSISTEQSIEIRPLTLLAGANSSGKSSIMQPLLLMKQTLEASYDPGTLLLDGPNLKFKSVGELLSRTNDSSIFSLALAIGSDNPIRTVFGKGRVGIEIQKVILDVKPMPETILYTGMTHEEIMSSSLVELGSGLREAVKRSQLEFCIIQNRCFLDLAFKIKTASGMRALPVDTLFGMFGLPAGSQITSGLLELWIQDLIHLPGLRGNPVRTYPVTAVGDTFPGTFENYTASVIAQWQADNQTNQLNILSNELATLGLTDSVAADPINDTQVELRVGRLPHSTGDKQDMVSIADVGFGVSQTLPVLVALLTAKPGQLVYLEQPEIHLHPRAQTAMAQVLADAAIRGVRVVAETHSSLLLLGVQTLIAEGKLSPDLVKLHWFTRGEDGATTIQSADLDETGAFGDWPEDFDDVTLNAQSRYMDAAEARLAVK